jgi:1-phosphatidylinositol-3-phosphate 5-kinase
MSMFHLRLMLRQMLTKEAIPNLPEWEETLLNLALRIARELTFTAYPQRQGADMDVRRYVKIKKVPGGSPKDSECIDGAVITKNVAHKSMLRQQRNPRIMLVTFPLEFSRVEGQYMHFGQILRQEKEYLGNLTSRILALRPHVVLVEKSVSRLVLDALAKQNIAVARSVKPSAIQFVARMTQADLFSSLDKLALEPRLGHSGRFSVQTFDHPLIPGRRKSLMRFAGCNREMGCTIVLRGGDLDTLRRIKKVTRFLMFIVRNLKLETHLWKDSVISLPNLTADAVAAPFLPQARQSIPLSVTLARFAAAPLSTASTPALAYIEEFSGTEYDLPDDDLEQIHLSRRIQQSLDPYLTTFISVSATLRFPPPYPIRHMKELDDKLIRVKRAWEDEVVRREESQHSRDATMTPFGILSSVASLDTPMFNCDDIGAQIESLACPDLPMTPSTPPITPTPGHLRSSNEAGYFDHRLPSSSSQSSSNFSTLAVSPSLAKPQAPLEEPPVQLKTMEDIALESELSFVKWQHQEQQRIWEWYLRKNADDFVVEKYQFISLWESILPSPEYGALPPCFPPRLKYITYYGENDCTLGQFVESSVLEMVGWSMDPKQPACAGKGCNFPAARHCKSYVHNESRILIAVEPWDGQIVGTGSSPSPELVTTWSACRICGSATPFIPVSEEMQRYSFAKFLELHFYPADVQLVQGAGCEHNIYRHHIRFFAARGMTVRIQTDPVVLHEVVYPPRRIRVRPETQLVLKNVDYERLHRRNFLWYSALVDDLKLINIDAATGDEEADASLTATVNQLIGRAELEMAEVTHLLNAIYRESAPTDTLALNRLRSFRQDKIVAWQADFDKLPKPRPIVEREKQPKRASTFGTMRAIWPRRYDQLAGGLYDSSAAPSSSVSEAEESTPSTSLSRRITGDSMLSSASDMSDSEGMPSVRRRNRKELASTMTVTGLPPLESPVTEDALATSWNETPKSDVESDSTIGATKGDAPTEDENDMETPLPLQSPLVVSVRFRMVGR